MKLCKEFKDVFAWTYDDLKTFDSSIMQHNILQFVFLLQVEIHMAYMHFEGLYLAHV